MDWFPGLKPQENANNLSKNDLISTQGATFCLWWNLSLIPRKATQTRSSTGSKALWDAEKFVEADAKSPVGERSTFRIASINKILWFCVYTRREKKIRLISVRRVRPAEKEFYEQS